MRTICIFCASGKEYIAPFASKTDELVSYCSANNISIIYGGAKVGLMGYVADSCHKMNVPITGIITEQIVAHELQHENVSPMHITNDMHSRKKMMYDLSDAFIVLPGSIGTLDEFFEVLCWSKIHIHEKPIGVFNIDGYYDKLIEFIEEKVAQKLMDADILNYFEIDSDVLNLLNKMRQWERPTHSNLTTEREKLKK